MDGDHRANALALQRKSLNQTDDVQGHQVPAEQGAQREQARIGQRGERQITARPAEQHPGRQCRPSIQAGEGDSIQHLIARGIPVRTPEDPGRRDQG